MAVGPNPPWYVYILRCSDGSYYVGHTTDVEDRLAVHNCGRGAIWTARRTPVSLAYSEVVEDEDKALRREAQLKGWSRAKKEALIPRDLAALNCHSRSRLRLTLVLRPFLRLFLLLDLDALDFRRLARAVVGAGGGGGDLVDRLHPFDHLAESGVLVVQRRRVAVHDEELRAGRVGVIRAGHRQDPAGVFGGVELGLELIAGPA